MENIVHWEATERAAVNKARERLKTAGKDWKVSSTFIYSSREITLRVHRRCVYFMQQKKEMRCIQRWMSAGTGCGHLLLKDSFTKHSPGKNITSLCTSHSLINRLIRYNLAASSRCCADKASGTFLQRMPLPFWLISGPVGVLAVSPKTHFILAAQKLPQMSCGVDAFTSWTSFFNSYHTLLVFHFKRVDLIERNYIFCGDFCFFLVFLSRSGCRWPFWTF